MPGGMVVVDIPRIILICSVLIASAPLYAADKDQAYFKTHPDEAKAKYAECQKMMEELAGAGKIAEMMQVAEDLECKAADKVIMFYQNNK